MPIQMHLSENKNIVFDSIDIALPVEKVVAGISVPLVLLNKRNKRQDGL